MINANIYGSIIEHIGRIIYGGVYEEGSKLSDKQGFRKDVLNAAPQFLQPVSDPTSPAFGQITGARPARAVQFGLKLLL